MTPTPDAISAHSSRDFNEYLARSEANLAALDASLARIERGWDGKLYLMRDGHGWLATLEQIRDLDAREAVEGKNGATK